MSDVTKTNDHASNCKSFAVSLCNYEDPYIQAFARNPERKPPEISLGTYVRALVVRLVTSEFISVHKKKCNVVSLGAGFDTLYWNLDNKPEKFIEVDLKDVVMRKSLIVSRHKFLRESLSKDVKIMPTGITSDNFYLLNADISQPEAALDQIVDQTQLNTSLPVLFLSECVLIYLESAVSQRLIQKIPEMFKAAYFLLYEQVRFDYEFAMT